MGIDFACLLYLGMDFEETGFKGQSTKTGQRILGRQRRWS